MSKDKKQKALVPRLRFPEFRDAPEWDRFLLGRLEDERRIELGRGKVISHDDMRANPGPYPVYSSSVIDNGLMGTYGDYLFDEELISWSVDGGGHFFYRPKHKFSITNVSGFMRVLSADIICQFLAYQLQRLHASETFNYVQKAHPSVIRTLYTVGLPDPSEQQRIADCLGSLDDLISAEGRKLAALRDHKKGLMQQLFPREGETRPRLRFPEFQDAGEWMDAKLGELSEIVRGGSPRPIDDFLTRDPDGLNWLKIGDLETGAKYVTATEDRVTPDALSKTRVIEPGDLILSNSMSFGRPYLSRITTCIHDGWIAVRKISKRLGSEFLYYAIMAPGAQAFFEDWASGGGIRNLNIDIVKNLPMRFPSPIEQHRIADCLSALDDLIAAQAAKLDALRAHKRGLMQQLFPSPEDVGT